jgi:hypothetical protein
MTRVTIAAALAAALAGLAPAARADRVVNGTTHTSVNRNVNASTTNVAVNRDIDVDVDRDYHPITTAATVVTDDVVTDVAVGTVVQTLPPACAAAQVGQVTYQQCGSTWYRPQYAGTQLTYVVVDPPR